MVLKGDLSGVLNLSVTAAQCCRQARCGHRGCRADFTLASHLGTGNRGVAPDDRADRGRHEKVVMNPLLAGPTAKIVVVAQYRRHDPGGPIGRCCDDAAAARILGFSPVWALGSVGAVSFFPVIEGVKQLTILGERGDASANAIRICGRRWTKAGRRVRVVMPKVGSDLNDVLIAGVP